MGAEEALVYLGGTGLWQTTTYVTISILLTIPTMWQAFAIIFVGFTYHPYHCETNNPAQLVPTADCAFYESCELYKYNASYKPEEKVGCQDKYIFYEDYYLPNQGSTIATEFGLWCKLYIVEVTQMCFTGGIMFGCFAIGPLSDYFGRKKVFFGAQFVMCLFGIAMAFSTNIYLFSLFQFLTGCFTMANDLAGYVLANELFPADIRSYIAPAQHLFDSVGMLSLTIFGYYVRHWRMFQLIVSLIPLITMTYWFHCPESVRWLLVNDRYAEAKKVLDRCAECNEIPPVPEEIIKMESVEVAQGSKHVSFWHYLRTGKTLKYFLVMCYQVFVCQLLLYGMTLMVQALPGDFFLFYFIISAIEVPGTLLAMFLAYFVGRRLPLSAMCVLAAVFLGLASLFTARPELVGNAALLATIFSCVAKLFVSAAWCIVLVYAQEIFPTNIRSAGVGAVAGVGFVGAFIAPLAVTMSRVSTYIPNAVFAALMFLAAFAALLCPETRGRILPTTHEEILSWGYTITKEDQIKIKEQKHAMAERKKEVLAYRHQMVSGTQNPAYEKGNDEDVKAP